MNMSYARGDGAIRIKHREFFGDIAGTTAFAGKKISLNPGLEASFPWLYAIANNYESYKFNSLTVEYETCCSTSTEGTVMIAIDYDASDDAPAEKKRLLAYHNAVRTAPWNRATMKASKPDLQRNGQKMTRNHPLGNNLDIKTYDAGNIFVYTQGFLMGTTCGELYLSYDIELHTPKVTTFAPYLESARIDSGGTVALATPFGTAPVKVVDAESPLLVDVSSNGITFNEPGQFLVDLYAGGTTISGTPTVTGTVESTPLTNIINAAATVSNDQWIVNAVAGATMFFNYATKAVALANVVMRLAPYKRALT